MRKKGKVASWNDDKGFGFIAPADGGERIFVHIKAFANRDRRPLANDVVTYDASEDKQGRARAVNAVLAGDKLAKQTRSSSGPPALLLTTLFFAVVGTSVVMTGLPLFVPAAYVLMSMVTFIAYAIDKSAAQAGRWRISESTLHILALAGGWPGAMLAQQALRHKSRKTSFRVFYWATVIINCAGLYWLHTSDGQVLLGRTLSVLG
jgi:uncharacterized membrane protein YsdA (DUF1294 family)/cold shock CspA family protein